MNNLQRIESITQFKDILEEMDENTKKDNVRVKKKASSG
jgi:hypothetical protein